ncbi:MAG: DNA-directed RNA polymerase subunit beta [Candidatus Magasanikbacteria bacterium GW2011_GWA2_46_17]|uniref:DNA-directed RNA polymerase subunit beta n=1 Tax=Candidatus Magasanikbacteria bacterium GW2011_GWA2_46_17 TaxID=1619042 RepID=A0A0G1NZ97_9BACT|nr:MAG: DNA-directed RNA polymerase subunit beta [Candidatus Magasanikbacteria bacterium GW2011_GWA2_46_17]
MCICRVVLLCNFAIWPRSRQSLMPMLNHSANIPRKYFGSLKPVPPWSNLIDIQISSYKWFFEQGLKDLFAEFSPLTDFIGRDLKLYFGDYYIDAPKFDERTARARNLSYEAALRVNCTLINQRTGEQRQQEVYLGDLPLMTDRGTFMINGNERVVVSQLIRSAGAFFTAEQSRDRRLYGAKVIPNRGAWLEIETDMLNVMYGKIDRKRKFPITTLLRAIGFATDDEIRGLFMALPKHPDYDFVEATLAKDPSMDQASALQEIYKRIRPGDMATAENAKALIFSMFFSPSRYDFGKVGRYKLNQRLQMEVPISRETMVLRPEDLTAIIREVVRLNVTQDLVDDIDHLGNRRVRGVGELLQQKMRIGFSRLERIVKDRMSTMDIETLTPNQLINVRPLIGSIKEFFLGHQLSQYMDQTNPLAETEHKRRLSAIGPGGLMREHASFEVRDVHHTHYGRICPTATSEGPNIGLISHLASYARINDYGFIETPMYQVIQAVKNDGVSGQGEILLTDVGGLPAGAVLGAKELKHLLNQKDLKEIPVRPRVKADIVYLDGFTSERAGCAPATAPVDINGYFINQRVEARKFGQPTILDISEIDYIDISPQQIVSVSTAIIPFLEHDDSARALMGTNMQRQAVSCVKPQAPIVGTGMEKYIARDSGHIILAKRAGAVSKLDASVIEIKTDQGEVDTYILNKFMQSNAGTSINQKPVIDIGEKVTAGALLADGPATEGGELALGQNLLVAFVPWEGFNYEDAIILSERVVHSDRYTSIHIENYAVDVRDTKLGPEILTRDIPNVSEEKLANLDEDGIIRLGAEVKSGDILVGKITPKGEVDMTAEERLLRAIFGEKAKDIRDSSKYLEHGEHGKIVDIKIFSRQQGDKLQSGIIKTVQVSVAHLRKIQVGDKMAGRHGNKGVISRIVPVEDMPHLADGTPVDIILNPLGVTSRMNLGQILETHLGLAAAALGYKAATPVFDGAKIANIQAELKKAGFEGSGQVVLKSGKTGEAFERPATVGYIYMLKLNHLVEDKVHQRSIGPYSLVTQQPLGGRAQSGGQRFGEMEVWAVEAYGAAHVLQELLTIKSDDVIGRSKAYESIIKGEPIKTVTVPESFNVLVREMKGLGLDVKLIEPYKVEEETSSS